MDNRSLTPGICNLLATEHLSSNPATAFKMEILQHANDKSKYEDILDELAHIPPSELSDKDHITRTICYLMAPTKKNYLSFANDCLKQIKEAIPDEKLEEIATCLNMIHASDFLQYNNNPIWKILSSCYQLIARKTKDKGKSDSYLSKACECLFNIRVEFLKEDDVSFLQQHIPLLRSIADKSSAEEDYLHALYALNYIATEYRTAQDWLNLGYTHYYYVIQAISAQTFVDEYDQLEKARNGFYEYSKTLRPHQSLEWAKLQHMYVLIHRTCHEYSYLTRMELPNVSLSCFDKISENERDLSHWRDWLYAKTESIFHQEAVGKQKFVDIFKDILNVKFIFDNKIPKENRSRLEWQILARIHEALGIYAQVSETKCPDTSRKYLKKALNIHYWILTQTTSPWLTQTKDIERLYRRIYDTYRNDKLHNDELDKIDGMLFYLGINIASISVVKPENHNLLTTDYFDKVAQAITSNTKYFYLRDDLETLVDILRIMQTKNIMCQGVRDFVAGSIWKRWEVDIKKKAITLAGQSQSLFSNSSQQENPASAEQTTTMIKPELLKLYV